MAILGVAVLAISIYALRQPAHSSAQAGNDKSTSAAPHHTSAPASRTPTRSVVPNGGSSETKLPLIVLNNTTIHGLAQQAANTFTAGGWRVTGVDNLQNEIVSTCAYYDPSVPGAQAAAGALMRQFPAIKRTAPKFDGLPSGPIVVVLTPDYLSG